MFEDYSSPCRCHSIVAGRIRAKGDTRRVDKFCKTKMVSEKKNPGDPRSCLGSRKCILDCLLISGKRFVSLRRRGNVCVPMSVCACDKNFPKKENRLRGGRVEEEVAVSERRVKFIAI